MARKAASGEGSIAKRPDGRWQVRITLAGRRRSFYGATQREALAKRDKARADVAQGIDAVAGRETVGAYLAGWLEGVRPSLRPGTFRRYSDFVRLHVTDIAHIRLADVSGHDLQRLYTRRLGTGLAPATVRQLHAVLRKAFADAVRRRVLGRNPAEGATPPRATRKELQVLSPEAARAFLAAAASDRLSALFVLALSTGAREGECLALRWSAIDLAAGTAQISATLQRESGDYGPRLTEPKTKRSRRLVTLPTVAIEALRAHKVAQNAERLAMGNAWEDNGLVFCTEVGTAIDAGNMLRRHFRPALERAGLPPMRFHDLRHTAATLALGKGIHPKIVSDMLGHSSIAITLDLYSHVTPTMAREAASALDAVLRG